MATPKKKAGTTKAKNLVKKTTGTKIVKKDKKPPVKPEDRKLTLKQTLFVKYYLFWYTDKDDKEKTFRLWNALQSYGKAYAKKMNTDAQKSMCWVEWYTNLNKPNIQKYMAVMLKNEWFNHHVIDARLLSIAKSWEDKDAIAAIREYNKLLDRITDRFEWTVSLNIADELKSLNRKKQRDEE